MPYVIAALCGLSILVGQYFYGGLFRPALAFSSYFILGISALLAAGYLFFPRREKPRAAGIWTVALLLGWIIWRTTIADGLPLAATFQELGLGCFIIYLLLAYVVVRPDARILFLVILLLGALIQSVVAGGQFFGIWGGQPQGWISEQLRLWYDRGESPTIYRRAHGFYINGNHLAWILNSAGFFALAMGAFGRGRAVAKVIWTYLGGLCLAVSLLCLSRGGLLALAVGMIFVFILSVVAICFGVPGRRIASFSVLLGAFAIPSGVVLFILSQNDSIRARAAFLFEEGYRPQIWGVAWREFQLHPWLGAGPGAFTYFARQFRMETSATDDYFAHNDWLQLAADFGYPALILAMVVLVVHLTIGCRAYIRILRDRVSGLIPQSNSAAILIGAAASMVAFAVHSLFDFNMQLPANALLAAACMGILANSGQGGRTSQDGHGRWEALTKRSGMILLGAAGLWLLICLWGNRYEIGRIRAENFMVGGEPALAWQVAEEAIPPGKEIFALRYIEGSAHQKLAETTRDAQQKNAELVAAQRALRLAIQAAPNERSSNIEMARSLLMAGKLKEAKNLAFEAIHLEPRQVTGYELYGAVLEAEGNRDDARRVYRIGAAMNYTPFLKERLELLGKEP